MLLPRQQRRPCLGTRELTQPPPTTGRSERREAESGAAAPEPTPAIEDYAVIGDCQTAALVSRGGSIDWLCWPRFDSPAAFAALLGQPANGRWRIGPAAAGARVSRRYRPGTLILETLFETEHGSVTLIDCMVPGRDSLVRIVEGRSGSVAMRLDVALRFDYGSAVPWVTRLSHRHGVLAVAGPDLVVLHSDVPLHGRHLTHVAAFDVVAGERVRFVMTHGLSYRPAPHVPDADTALAEAETFWTEWSARCTYHGKWRDAVLRSLITLKALSYAPTGGIVAAPTTSLPEQLGGPRNWDYRFCWLRDATFTLMALMHAGYHDEARAWGAWLRRSVAGTPAQVQTLYGLAGERWIMEWEVPWLAGYQGSKPVRVGNAASTQVQLDVYGELIDALYQEVHGGLVPPGEGWDLLTALAGHLEEIWEQPDESIWEVRGGAKQFTFSKAMAWVAIDRVIRTAEEFALKGPLDEWRALRTRIHDTVCRDGFNAAKGAFVQYLWLRRAGRQPAAAAAGRFSPRRRAAHARHDRGDRAGADGGRPGAALSHPQGRGRAAGRRGHVPGVQLLVRRLPDVIGPPPRGAGTVREAAGPVQRCRPAGRGIRSRRAPATGQFPAGVLASGTDQHGAEPGECARPGASAAARRGIHDPS